MLRAKSLVLGGVVAALVLGCGMAGPAWAQASPMDQQLNAIRKALAPNKVWGNRLRRVDPSAGWYVIELHEKTRQSATSMYAKVCGIDEAAMRILAFLTERGTGKRGFRVQLFFNEAEAQIYYQQKVAQALMRGGRPIPVASSSSSY